MGVAWHEAMRRVWQMGSTMRMLDLFCGAGGAAKGYHDSGITSIDGVDLEPQKNYPYNFIQAEALAYCEKHAAEYDVIHASPPCQGYTIMHNLPWLAGREYPRLIKPLRELLKTTGKHWIIENVMGAKYQKNLERISERLGEDITDHRMEGNWLCGMMFSKPFYRHRMFETSFEWLMPSHPKHPKPVRRGSFPERNLLVGNGGQGEPVHPNPVNAEWRTFHDGSGKLRQGESKISLEGSLNFRDGYEHVAFSYPTILGDYGHSHKGWRLAGMVMDIDWMNRDELTQAIPPVFTAYIGGWLVNL